MRLLMINYEYPPLGGGAGNATANLAKAAAESGHEVMIVTSAFPGLKTTEHSDNIAIHRLPVRRKTKDRCTIFEMITFISSAVFRAPVLVANFKPDVGLAFFSIPGGPVAWYLRHRFGLPYVILLRGGDVPGTEPGAMMQIVYALTSPLTRLVWRHATRIIANSEGLRQAALRFTPHIAVEVVPNGVDTTMFHPALSTTESAAPIIIAAGRLTRQKGFDVLLQAMRELRTKHPPRLRIIGDGPMRTELEQMRDQLNLKDAVEFLGWIDRQDVAAAFRTADIFVLSSRYEGMANTLLEAMASGLAVIATDVEGCRDVINDGKNGFIVEAEDATAIAVAIDTVTADSALRRRLAANARDTVEQYFTWERALSGLLKVSSDIVAEH